VISTALGITYLVRLIHRDSHSNPTVKMVWRENTSFTCENRISLDPSRHSHVFPSVGSYLCASTNYLHSTGNILDLGIPRTGSIDAYANESSATNTMHNNRGRVMMLSNTNKGAHTYYSTPLKHCGHNRNLRSHDR
jgi:hypothetical protein